MQPKYKRILLKLSGEAMAGDAKTGLDFDTVLTFAEAVKECAELGKQIGMSIYIQHEDIFNAMHTV